VDPKALVSAAQAIVALLKQYQQTFTALMESRDELDQTRAAVHSYRYAEFLSSIGELRSHPQIGSVLQQLGMLPAIGAHLRALEETLKPLVVVVRPRAVSRSPIGSGGDTPITFPKAVA
jgi:hypothetical protein